ncbi:hypothetical protein [Streptomyces sp. NPDC021608]|uniref:hypothetical protein n=1 Tax=Streptomyces sp. NPDC021608 TaxID=3154903 RepID=UPI0033ECF81A
MDGGLAVAPAGVGRDRRPAGAPASAAPLLTAARGPPLRLVAVIVEAVVLVVGVALVVGVVLVRPLPGGGGVRFARVRLRVVGLRVVRLGVVPLGLVRLRAVRLGLRVGQPRLRLVRALRIRA